MAFYDLYPGIPDEDHPAIVEHRVSVDAKGVPHETVQTFSQTGHEAPQVDPADRFGVDYEPRVAANAPKVGELAMTGARRF